MLETRPMSITDPWALLNVHYIKISNKLIPMAGKTGSGLYPDITGRLGLELWQKMPMKGISYG